jgi:hypothetical protein
MTKKNKHTAGAKSRRTFAAGGRAFTPVNGKKMKGRRHNLPAFEYVFSILP